MKQRKATQVPCQQGIYRVRTDPLQRKAATNKAIVKVRDTGMNTGTGTKRRFLVLAIRAIGDVMLITPILRLLKQQFPDSYLAVVADGPSADVLIHNPHVDRVFNINRRQSRDLSWQQRFSQTLRLLTDLRAERFDTAVDLFSGPRSALLTWLCGARDRYGEDVRARGRGILYNHPIPIRHDDRHLVEQKLELIRPLVGQVERVNAYLEIHLTEEERKQTLSRFPTFEGKSRRSVGFVPASGSVWRNWPAERFAELGDLLAKEYNLDLFLFGGKEDIPICQRMTQMMTATPHDISGKTSLRELVILLSEVDLVIANVTGPMHLAVALGKPKVIGLYGAADTVQYAPWGPGATMMRKWPSSHAYWRNVDYQRDYECLLHITVADVLDSVRKLMG